MHASVHDMTFSSFAFSPRNKVTFKEQPCLSLSASEDGVTVKDRESDSHLCSESL